MDTRPGRLDPVVIGRIGRAAEGLLASLDASLEPARGTGAYVYVGGRVIQGWAIALLYIALLVPFLLCLADLVARLRRWHVPLVPAVRSYVRRLGFWLFAGIVFALFGMAGAWPGGDEAAINPASEAASHWPRLAIALFLLVVLAGWLVARARLVPEGPVASEDEVAGMAVALCALAIVSLVMIVTNPMGLLFVLPSAHAWLWLVQARNRGALRADQPLRHRPGRPHPRPRLDGAAVRPRPRRALVPCGADRARLRVSTHAPPHPRLDRRRRPGAGRRDRPLRAVSGAGGSPRTRRGGHRHRRSP